MKSSPFQFVKESEWGAFKWDSGRQYKDRELCRKKGNRPVKKEENDQGRRSRTCPALGIASEFAGGLLLDMDVMAAVVARDMACLILGCRQHLGEFDAGFVTHLVQHPDHVLGRQVAGGTGSKGTAAQTAQSGPCPVHGCRGNGPADSVWDRLPSAHQ